MKKQEILSEYYKLLKIENYSDQTIKSYYSALKLDSVTDKAIKDYLYFCKTKRKQRFIHCAIVLQHIF